MDVRPSSLSSLFSSRSLTDPSSLPNLHQVICDPSIEFIHGGLDKQVTHHLFPRLPRHNLRAASLLVKEFCKEQDLEFAEWGFVEGSAQVMSVVSFLSSRLRFEEETNASFEEERKNQH